MGQAAIELNVSRPAVTAAIRQLEDDVGLALFKRLPTGMALTAEGARFRSVRVTSWRPSMPPSMRR